jgi:hypothetical protein
VRHGPVSFSNMLYNTILRTETPPGASLQADYEAEKIQAYSYNTVDDP